MMISVNDAVIIGTLAAPGPAVIDDARGGALATCSLEVVTPLPTAPDTSHVVLVPCLAYAPAVVAVLRQATPGQRLMLKGHLGYSWAASVGMALIVRSATILQGAH